MERLCTARMRSIPIVQFKPELMGWECEDCTYTQPMNEEPSWMASATPGS
jgi:hypothetical protein